jgi:hypothetical protein
MKNLECMQRNIHQGMIFRISDLWEDWQEMSEGMSRGQDLQGLISYAEKHTLCSPSDTHTL